MKLRLRGERVVREDFEVTPHEAYSALVAALIEKLTPADIKPIPKDDLYLDDEGHWHTSEHYGHGSGCDTRHRKATPEEKALWAALTNWKHLSLDLVACLEKPTWGCEMTVQELICSTRRPSDRHGAARTVRNHRACVRKPVVLGH